MPIVIDDGCCERYQAKDYLHQAINIPVPLGPKAVWRCKLSRINILIVVIYVDISVIPKKEDKWVQIEYWKSIFEEQFNLILTQNIKSCH